MVQWNNAVISVCPIGPGDSVADDRLGVHVIPGRVDVVLDGVLVPGRSDLAVPGYEPVLRRNALVPPKNKHVLRCYDDVQAGYVLVARSYDYVPLSYQLVGRSYVDVHPGYQHIA